MNLLTSLLTLAAWTVWGYTVLYIDPEVTLAPALFYAALFVALTGTLSRLLAGPAASPGDPASTPLPSFGHAAAVSILILFALWLQSLGMLTPLNGILLATTFVLVELGFFLSGGGRRARSRRRPRRSAGYEPGSASEQ